MKINTHQLKYLVNGTVFYEDDYSTRVYVFQKATDDDSDVFVKTLHGGGDQETCRLGLKEMDDCDKNSKKWIIPEESELADMQETLAISVYARREFDKAQVL